ncbi:MAG: hypothetical protein A3C06_00125 [Candidatus Taylorbacteria bacterium RIFCSPHIGHO2_02_FULL_46_13]|uniref:Carboxypeptidase regulatory-like domain-containing protein n=1 Tax=Candidatus Taylorbacteria bacterium RIFCSPHIGHO2_02_FULL_46_13 TaxID=1802312 RepID=A0A1G2MS73_9BACT|nr:MAG: hypothetical protein A3C06_00125 [Candidatus Taylorbacteria bacterium RIFCSPHIGHO2_02_FULL_46_13]
MNLINFKNSRGFTFVEVLVSISIFLIVCLTIYGVFVSILSLVSASRLKSVAAALANEQIEIARNLPYANVGTLTGIPHGLLSPSQTLVRGGAEFIVTTIVRNIDDSFDGTIGGAPNDLVPADYKLVDVTIECSNCKNFVPFSLSTFVAPKNLEFSSANNGALFVKVFDANGQPITGALVHLENNTETPAIIIDDVTGIDGTLQLVDVPPGTEVYEVSATKSGYTTDQTRDPGVSGNPNPTIPHSTVAAEQVTALSLFIDRFSSFSFSSVTDQCTLVPDMDFTLSGTRLIGTDPDVLKYSQNLETSVGGLLSLSNIEWDTYSLSFIDANYDVIGTNPLFPLAIAPTATQNVQLIVAPKAPRTLIVIVKDTTTGLPVSGASVSLGNGAASTTLVTGLGSIAQTDWSGGDGEATSTDTTRFWNSDGNIDTNNPSGVLSLISNAGEYVSSGELVSSAFDTGSASNFHTFSWQPQSQLPDVGDDSVKFQAATSDDGGVWDYSGPDGTSATYYTLADSNINLAQNGKRYFRYKLFLSTATTTQTPTVSDIAFTFTSACVPPGQVAFTNLSSGNRGLSVEKSGYQTAETSVSVANDWQNIDILLSPL